jgi:hypothetical protein
MPVTLAPAIPLFKAFSDACEFSVGNDRNNGYLNYPGKPNKMLVVIKIEPAYNYLVRHVLKWIVFFPKRTVILSRHTRWLP